MGNACGGLQKKRTKKIKTEHRRDFHQSIIMKPEELDRAVAREETTTSYENITKLYNFKKEIGHGHFGTVRLATSVSNPSQKFAIKAIEKQKLKKDLYLLKRELQILKKLDHPNVIKFYESYQDERYFYFIMEYCSGGELLDRIAQKGRLAEQEVKTIMKKAFSAMKHLHTLGIVHRDLKPENFMFSSKDADGDIKIIDFGLSKFLGDAPNCRLTTAVGTALYMAPEILKGNYDERCDNWSLGVLMYVLLSGSPPFSGDNANAVFQKIVKGNYSLKGPQWKKISSQAKNLIQGLLVTNPDERFTSTEALEHEWFRIGMEPKVGGFDERTLSLLKKFRETENDNVWKNQVKKVIITNLGDNEIKTAREVYKSMDRENKGFFTGYDLQKAMEEAGIKNADKEVKSLIEKANVNMTQPLFSNTAFLIAVVDEKTLYTEDRLMTAFKHFDSRKSGEINADGIKDNIITSGRKMSDEELKKMMTGTTFRTNGKMSYDEFKASIGA